MVDEYSGDTLAEPNTRTSLRHLVQASQLLPSVPTLFREEYLDSLRVLSRQGEATAFITAMQKIHRWMNLQPASSAFEPAVREHQAP